METFEFTCAVDPEMPRRAEYAALRRAGARDLPFGRLYEGHVNAVQLVALYGSADARRDALRAVESGALFGVWNTQDANGVRIASMDDDGITLTGAKTFCSGAGTVAHAIVTAAVPGGGSQMLLVPMHDVPVAIDPTFWHPMGMERSDSFAVDFGGVRVAHRNAIGPVDAYQREPWFSAGAARFVAVQTGALERLTGDLATFLVTANRADDAIQRARLGACAVRTRTAVLWTDACAAAWERFDHDGDAEPLHETVDAARIAVERAALDAMEDIERAVGARGLNEPQPFGARIRDLRMYLRQPAPDAALARVGSAAAARARTQ
jgi:alkylation response protein AidB-like acyl-CoA dehydrogenase